MCKMVTKPRTMKQRWTDLCPPHLISWPERDILLLGKERVPFPCTWQWLNVLPNSTWVLATPTQVKAPPPHRYYKKLTLYLAETRTIFYISSTGFISTCPCDPSSSSVKSSVRHCNAMALIYYSKITQKTSCWFTVKGVIMEPGTGKVLVFPLLGTSF